jgi:hypothetical protein
MSLLRWHRRMAARAPPRWLAGRSASLDRIMPLSAIFCGRKKTRHERFASPLAAIPSSHSIERIYQPNWVGKMDHFKIDLQPGGGFGPWIHIYSPMNKETNGRDPVSMQKLASAFAFLISFS